MWAAQVSFQAHTNLRFSSFGPQYGWMLLPASPCRAWIKNTQSALNLIPREKRSCGDLKNKTKTKRKAKKINIFFVKKGGCVCFRLTWRGRLYVIEQVQQQGDRCTFKAFVLGSYYYCYYYSYYSYYYYYWATRPFDSPDRTIVQQAFKPHSCTRRLAVTSGSRLLDLWGGCESI